MTRVCPQCDATTSDEARFCAACGTALSGCASCGAVRPPGAQYCPSCGNAFGGDEPPHERKVVTVLFADLVGSTAIADGRDPEQVAMILSAYATTVRETIRAWGGTVEKFIGDAVVGVFGIPATHEDDPARAVRAAADVHAKVYELNKRLDAAHGVRLSVRIGVNTGDVFAATSAGLDQRFMAGDVVNVAARLEQACEPGGVLASVRTAEGAGDAFTFGPATPHELKGKSRAVHAHSLLAVSDATPARGSLEADRRLQAPLVGRDHELERLDTTFAEVCESASPRLALISAAAGLGKSRLTREFLAQAVTKRAELRVVGGRCLAVGSGVTYWALGEIVRDVCGISLDEHAETAATKILTVVQSLMTDEVAADALGVGHALATTAGVRIESNPLERIRPIEVEAALTRAWPRFTAALARERPTVLWIEDLHWADEQLLMMLQAIVIRSTGPLLVLATARPEFAEAHPDFAAATAVSTLPLTALTPEAAETLAASVLESPTIAAQLRDVLLERAEGNPLFLEQLIGGLIDSGALHRRDGEWTLDRSATADRLPDSIHALLAARIDLLNAADKHILQEAAVIGRAFWPDAVAASTAQHAVETALRSLEAKDLIVMRTSSSIGGQTEFAFKHALVRDVAYGAIPLARRARSHARVAEWLQSMERPDDDALVELIAHHYRSALLGDGAEIAWIDDVDRREEVRAHAFPSLLAAGSAARKRNATARALEIHGAALEIAVTDREQAAALEELGDDHGWSYHGDPSTDAWNQALERWQRIGDDDACARVCMKAARHTAVYWGGFAARPLGETVDGYIDEGLRRVSDPRLRAQLLALSGLARASYTRTGRSDPRTREQRIAAVEQATAIATELDDADVQALAIRSLGGLYLDADRPADALRLADLQLTTVDRVSALRDRLLNTSLALAQLMDLGGRFERAAELALRVRADSTDMSAHERMHATYFVMAALFRLGRWADIVPLTAEHLAAFEEETVDMDCPFTRGGPVIGAIVLDCLGKEDDAAAVSKSIVPNEEVPGLVEAWIAERALLAGDPTTAVERARRTLEFGRGPSVEEPLYEVPVLIDGLAALGDWTAMREAIATASGRRVNVAWLAPTIDRAEAAELAAQGDIAGAVARLRRALEAYRGLSMLPDVARTLDVIADLTAGDDAAAGHRAEAATIRSAMLQPARTE
jgi:class 3 adenylate cyclase